MVEKFQCPSCHKYELIEEWGKYAGKDVSMLKCENCGFEAPGDVKP